MNAKIGQKKFQNSEKDGYSLFDLLTSAVRFYIRISAIYYMVFPVRTISTICWLPLSLKYVNDVRKGQNKKVQPLSEIIMTCMT